MLTPECREKFVKLMRQYERFCGVKVLSYCVMSNHFHILLKVKPVNSENLSDQELLKRVASIQSAATVAELERVLGEYTEARRAGVLTEEGERAYRELRARYTSRMGDLAKFMKPLKQQFSRWYNKQHRRKGTLWEERFHSSLVESGWATLVTSAYIDLNPVRAGMVQDPKSYRWSSYGAAAGGCQLAREAMLGLLKSSGCEAGLLDVKPDHAKKFMAEVNEADQLAGWAWRRVSSAYRVLLFNEGQEPGEIDKKMPVREKRKPPVKDSPRNR